MIFNGINLVSYFLLPPEDFLIRDFGFRGLHVEGWDIIHYLGRGVSSHVYAARSLQNPDVQVALKVRQGEFHGVLAEEIRFMEVVASPCLPTLVDRFSYDPRERRYKRIDAESDLPIDAIAISPVGKRYHGTSLFEFYPEYVDNLVDAIKALHDKDIVHRDIRPDNVIFAEHPDSVFKRAYLIDLGFCCRLEDQPCSYSGTLRYASDDVLRACVLDRNHVTVSKRDESFSLFYTILALADRSFSEALHRVDPKDGMEEYIEARRYAVQRRTRVIPFLKLILENPSVELIQEEWRKHFALPDDFLC